MRVLLDEQIDGRLARAFGPRHEVVTVRGQGWLGRANGALLRAAAAEFDAFVTMDRGIEHQQNLSALPLIVVLVLARSNRRADVAPLVPDIVDALARGTVGTVTRVGAAPPGRIGA